MVIGLSALTARHDAKTWRNKSKETGGLEPLIRRCPKEDTQLL